MLRPEDPISNTGHGMEQPEKLKGRVPSSRLNKLSSEYANKEARKLKNEMEAVLFQKDVRKITLNNLEDESENIKAQNSENVDAHHSEHVIYNVDAHQNPEGENQDLPLSPNWKSTVPQWKNLN